MSVKASYVHYRQGKLAEQSALSYASMHAAVKIFDVSPLRIHVMYKQKEPVKGKRLGMFPVISKLHSRLCRHSG